MSKSTGKPKGAAWRKTTRKGERVLEEAMPYALDEGLVRAARMSGKRVKTCTRAGLRTVATKYGQAIRLPDGRLYYGTAEEIRNAALMPRGRRALAESLCVLRRVRDCGGLDVDEFRMACAASRRDAIFARELDRDGVAIRIPAAVFLQLFAGSRLVSDTFDGYVEDLCRADIGMLKDIAEQETGKREIPMTRHEKAAMARLVAGC